MTITLEKSVLRPWQRGDEDSLVNNANNINVWENLRDLFPYPYRVSDAKAWIKRASSETPLANFAIEVDGNAVGSIGIAIQSGVYRCNAELGYWLGQMHWRQGIMTEAVVAVTEYAFETFEISRVFATVYEWNSGSMRVLEKAGFEKEARLKQSVIKLGRIGDVFIYAQRKA